MRLGRVFCNDGVLCWIGPMDGWWCWLLPRPLTGDGKNIEQNVMMEKVAGVGMEVSEQDRNAEIGGLLEEVSESA